MMKSVVAALALLSGASAFTTPAATKSSSSALQMTAWDKYDGGFDFRMQEFKFDPLKLSETYEPFLPWFREAEIKHGRTAMLAVLGFIVPDFVRIPGDIYSFQAIPKTVDAHDALLTKGPMSQLLLWIGLWELIVTAPACAALMKGEREPGDYGWTAFAPNDDATMKKKQNSELLNGRLAMCAIGGIATQTVITGHGFPYL